MKHLMWCSSDSEASDGKKRGVSGDRSEAKQVVDVAQEAHR